MIKKEELILGECPDNKGYTIYKNADLEMVEAIKNFKLPRENFIYFRHNGCNIVQVLNETQNLCIDENKEYIIITNEEIDKTLSKNLINEINAKFSLKNAIQRSFGDLYDKDGFMKKRINVNENGKPGDLGSVSYSDVGLDLRVSNDQIRLLEKNGDWSSIMFCHLNKDGNIVNRDYNINLTNFIGNAPKQKNYIIEQIIKHIPNEKYLYYANKWFTEKFVLSLTKTYDERSEKIIFKLDRFEIKPNGNYGEKYNGGNIKMPKKVVEVDKNHLLQILLPLVNETEYAGDKVDLSKYITVTEKQSEIPTKRIQETKIEEKNFEIFDFSKYGEDEDEDILNNEELMLALNNIENSIDIGYNEEVVKEIIEEYLHECCDLPSFSFNKGERQKNHSKYKGLVKLPHGCNFTFEVEEGDVCEITHSHSIYSTDIVNFELVV